MKNKIIYTLLTLFCIACKKEALYLESDVAIPLAYTDLSIQNIVPDSLYTIENGNIILSYQDTIKALDLKDFVVVPDTSISDTIKFSSNFPLSFAPGSSIANIVRRVKMPLGDAKLKLIEIKSGNLSNTITNFLNQPIRINYNFNNGRDIANNVLALQQVIPANTLVEKIINVTDTKFDLTDGALNFNLINTSMSAQVDNTATGSINLTPQQNMVKAKIQFKNVVPKYAEGYFGKRTIEKESDVNIDVFKMVQSGQIDFESINLEMNVLNSIGVDATIEILELKAVNTINNTSFNLIHSAVGGSTNINRGYKQNNTARASSTKILFNNTNSNITNFISQLPNKLHYKVKIITNPLGNISHYTDFVYNTSSLDIGIKLRIPLKFKTQNLTLIDTIPVNDALKTDNIYLSGNLNLIAKNNIPQQFRVQIIGLDIAKNSIKTILPNTFIEAGTLNNIQKSIISIPLNTDELESFKKIKYLVVQTILNTPSNTFFDWNSLYKINLRFTYTGIVGR